MKPAEPAGIVQQIAEPLLPSPVTCAYDHAETIKTVGKVAMGTGAAVLVGMAVLNLFRR